MNALAKSNVADVVKMQSIQWLEPHDQWGGPVCKEIRREGGPETVRILSWWLHESTGVRYTELLTV